jgi:acetyl esterase/lipase
MRSTFFDSRFTVSYMFRLHRLLFIFQIVAVAALHAQTVEPLPREQSDILYRDVATSTAESLDYINARCRLDVYLPTDTALKAYPLIVWFHGGGLTGGNKTAKDEQTAARRLAAHGVAVVLANYRLTPKVHYPVYLEDAAAAVRWTTDHAVALGADPQRVYVGGFSAGGYLTAMLALDEHYLKDAQAGSIAGFVAMSGQMTTHFSIRAETGLPKDTIIVNEAAPLAHVRSGIPRLLLAIGDRDWAARLEENQLLSAALEKLGKNPPVPLLVVPDRTHATMLARFLEDDSEPTGVAVLAFLRQ